MFVSRRNSIRSFRWKPSLDKTCMDDEEEDPLLQEDFLRTSSGSPRQPILSRQRSNTTSPRFVRSNTTIPKDDPLLLKRTLTRRRSYSSILVGSTTTTKTTRHSQRPVLSNQTFSQITRRSSCTISKFDPNTTNSTIDDDEETVDQVIVPTATTSTPLTSLKRSLGSLRPRRNHHGAMLLPHELKPKDDDESTNQRAPRTDQNKPDGQNDRPEEDPPLLNQSKRWGRVRSLMWNNNNKTNKTNRSKHETNTTSTTSTGKTGKKSNNQGSSYSSKRWNVSVKSKQSTTTAATTTTTTTTATTATTNTPPCTPDRDTPSPNKTTTPPRKTNTSLSVVPSSTTTLCEPVPLERGRSRRQRSLDDDPTVTTMDTSIVYDIDNEAQEQPKGGGAHCWMSCCTDDIWSCALGFGKEP